MSLKAVLVQNKTRRLNAILLVSDSGRGMSKEFLKNHLFKAFSQEGSFMEGAGLGMSLAAKIFKSLGGSIKAQSTKDVGTTITVTVPLDSSQHSSHEAFHQAARPNWKRFESLAVGIPEIGGLDAETMPLNQPVHKMSGHLLHESRKNTCTELGLRTLDINLLHPKAVDLYVVTEASSEILQNLLVG